MVVRVPAVAAKVAEMAPAATVTEAGTVSEALLSERATVLPPVGTAWFRVTVQVVDVPEFTLVGLQARAVTSMGATRVKLAVWEALFSVAVMVAVWLVVMVPRLAVKVVEVLLAGTVTEAGTLSAVLLLERATALPPVGAAWFRVTVQVVDAPEFTLVGLQASVETSTGATRLKVAVWEVPFRAAVTMAD